MAVLLWIVFGGSPDQASVVTEGSGVASGSGVVPALAFAPFTVAPEVVATWPADPGALHADLSDDERALLDAWQRANVVRALQARDLFEGDAEGVLLGWEAAVRRADQGGADASIDRVGWAAYAVFEDALSELLRKAEMTQTPVTTLLSDPTDITAQQAYEGCGDFVDFALEQQLIGANGERLASEEVLALVFRYRWMQAFTGRLPIDQRVPGGTLREFRRWRIEDAVLPLEDRLRLMDAYADTYWLSPNERRRARAVAYAESGDLERAEQVLAERD